MTDWSELSLDDEQVIIAVVAEEDEGRRSSKESPVEELDEQPVVKVKQCDCVACDWNLEVDCAWECTNNCSNEDCDGDCEA